MGPAGRNELVWYSKETKETKRFVVRLKGDSGVASV
jgi:hypothetical protein